MREPADKDPVVVIGCSDIHLSHQPPLARSCEENWYDAQDRTLVQLRKLRKKYPDAVFAYAGDIFDDGWREKRCPPELINFAIDYLPLGYAVPGQHDLPNHRYEDMDRSAYWTLCKAGVLVDLKPGHGVTPLGSEVCLHGYPWGYALKYPPKVSGIMLNVAVVHRFVWTKGCGYEGAKKEDHVSNSQLSEALAPFTVALFGDNHKGFAADVGNKAGKFYLFNCGTLMRRHADEKDYKPRVALVRRSGKVDAHFLDTKDEGFVTTIDPECPGETAARVEAFMEGLSEVVRDNVDFVRALERFMESRSVSEDVRRHVMGAVDRSKGK